MPTTSNRGVDLYYESDGDGGDGAPVVFVGDAGFGAWQWSVQHPGVAGPRRAVVWDLRGTGRSDVPPGPYEVDALAADLEAVLAAADVERAHVVGAGLGGMVALRYAREYGRARSLALFGTAASGEAADETALAALYPDERTDAALRASLDGALSPSFRRDHAEFVDQIVAWRRAGDADPDAVDAQLAALRAYEAGPLHEITLPALVGHGVDDPVIPAAAGEALGEDLPRGEYVPVAGRRLAFLEGGGAVTDRLHSFFEAVEDVETGQ